MNKTRRCLLRPGSPHAAQKTTVLCGADARYLESLLDENGQEVASTKECEIFKPCDDKD